MLSLEKCYEVLNQKNHKYTKEEVQELRRILYQFAEIIYKSKSLEDE